MALNGRLEDLNLLEILQIVAFAKKTGTLKVEGAIVSGAVLFRDGVILCALSSSTTPILSPEIRIALRVLLPLIHNHEGLSILYCDNPSSGRPLGNLSVLALFLAQAGMAMENASLHRRLRSFENEYSLENQGPLTQRLSPSLREPH